jgi:hypothetical protein
MARKSFRPTPEHRQLVEQLSAYGIPQADICAMIINPESGRKIDEQTLANNFRHELDTGTTKANARVAGALYTNATKHNNVTAQIFWLKTRARWKEPPSDEPIKTARPTIEVVGAMQGIDGELVDATAP